MTSASLPTDNLAVGPTRNRLRNHVARLWRRKRVRRSLVAAVAVAGLSFTATSGVPWVLPAAPPTPEQASAARIALLQLRASRDTGASSSPTRLTRQQLVAISSLASHGLHPNRFNVTVRGGVLTAELSRPLLAGRWLNLRASFSGSSHGFPSPHLSGGMLTLPASVGRYPFELGRAILRLRGADLPPLDQMVQSVSVEQDAVSVRLRLPRKSGIVDHLVGIRSSSIDPDAVAGAYCSLVAQQSIRPETDLAAQVRRAFTQREGSASPEQNAAAVIALAMLVADERAGYLAGVEPAQIASCRIGLPVVTLHGRSDLPKHWALSAAIAASQGTQLAQAVGEWKELADSVKLDDNFAAGDPSGFSFIDLAADRSGFLTAEAATSAETARATAGRLARVSPNELLPPVLLDEPDGLSSTEFQRRFGGIEAARYKAAVLEIDRVLAERW